MPSIYIVSTLSIQLSTVRTSTKVGKITIVNYGLYFAPNLGGCSNRNNKSSKDSLRNGALFSKYYITLGTARITCVVHFTITDQLSTFVIIIIVTGNFI
jgi:hypothetical protein